jgi:hypothetical protein
MRGMAQREPTLANNPQVTNKIVEKLTLTKATMCENINNFFPENEAIVFSVELKRVFCFTNFNPVPKKTHVYHIWYYKDQVITKHRLSLNPPQWSTYSSMQLRDYDKGPWRVEITDEHNKIFRILRFSVTD